MILTNIGKSNENLRSTNLEVGRSNRSGCAIFPRISANTFPEIRPEFPKSSAVLANSCLNPALMDFDRRTESESPPLFLQSLRNPRISYKNDPEINELPSLINGFGRYDFVTVGRV